MHATASKMDLLAGLVLQPGTFDDEAAAAARRIPHDWPGDHVETLRAQVEAKEISLVHVYENGARAGFLAYGIDGREFVIVSAFARTGENFTEKIMPQIEALALASGCSSLRFHTMRAGLIHKAIPLGFRISEIVLRKSL